MRKSDYPKVLRRGVAVMVILLLLLFFGAFAPVAMAQIANFTTNSPQIYCYNITFNDTTTGGTPPYTYDWDFGDGNSSIVQNTSHRYSKADTYNVTLTVTDAIGGTNSTTRQVVASDYTAELAITKEANVTAATLGDAVGYTINVSNTGNVNFTSVLVTDSLTGLNDTIPTLVPGATQTFNTTYNVTESDICGDIINIARTKGTDPCGLPYWQNNSYGVTPWYYSAVSITKEANVTSATVGDVIKYWYNVTNTGNVNVTDVLVTDVKMNLSETIAPRLAPGATQTFNMTYVVTQQDICNGFIVNYANVTAVDCCNITRPDGPKSWIVTTKYNADIAINKTANVSTATVGTVIGYNITVNNTGNVNLTNVLVTDSLTGLS